MPTVRRGWPGSGVRTGTLVIIAALIAACVSSPSLSPIPSGAPTPSPSSVAASPTLPVASTLPSPSPTPIVTGWLPAGTLTSEYDDATLVALADGRAIVIGHTIDRTGETFDRTVLETELWDPHTGGWQPSASLDLDRVEYATTGLADGRLLLVGGTDYEASYSSAHTLDPKTGTWLAVGSMAHDRSDPAAVLLPDGRVLVVGGYHRAPETTAMAGSGGLGSWGTTRDGSRAGASLFDVYTPPRGRALATAELFDPDTGTWEATGPMRYARTGPAITVLADGRVLVVGSTDDNVHIDDGAYRTAEVYDPGTGRFELVGSLPRLDRARIGGVQLPDSAPMSAVVGSLVALPDGGAVLIGRLEYWKRTAEVVRSFRMSEDGATWWEITEPIATDYRTEQRFTVSMLGSTVASLPDGSVLVAGGSFVGAWAWNEVEALPDEVRRYDPIAGAWSSLPHVPEGKTGQLGVRLGDGSIMVAGGVALGEAGALTPDWAPHAYRFVTAD